MGWRAVLRLAAAALLLAIHLPLWALARPFGRAQVVVRRFLQAIGWLLGLRVRREGTPAAHALLVANHISWLDILALGGATDTGFVAKAEIAGWPIVGWLAKRGGSVFVERERRAATRDQADRVAQALAAGRTITLFAEGGTGDGRAVLPFRAPLFSSAVAAGVSVQPVAIDYGPDRAALAWPSGVGFGRAAKALLDRRGRLPVTLRFLPPLDARALDRKQLALAAREAISQALAPPGM